MVALVAVEYRKVGEFLEKGRDGVIEVGYETKRTIKRREMSDKEEVQQWYYRAWLEGRQLEISSVEEREEGEKFAVIYLPEKLEAYRASDGSPFKGFILGDRKTPRWNLVEKALGPSVLWFAVCGASLLVFGVSVFVLVRGPEEAAHIVAKRVKALEGKESREFGDY